MLLIYAKQILNGLFLPLIRNAPFLPWVTAIYFEFIRFFRVRAIFCGSPSRCLISCRSSVSLIIKQLFQRAGKPSIHHRLILECIRSAQYVDAPDVQVREDRDEAWRTVIKHESAKRRRESGSVQAKSGRRIDFE